MQIAVKPDVRDAEAVADGPLPAVEVPRHEGDHTDRRTFLVGELELFKGQNAVMKALGGHLESVSPAEYEELLVKLADGAPAEEVISDDLVDELAIVGTPDECAAALKRYADSGVTEAGLSPVGMDAVQAAALVAGEIRPRLAA